MYGRQVEQISLDRKRVIVGDVSIGWKRHRGVKARTVPTHPALHSVKKILIAVIADAGFLVRRDVSRVEHPKRRGKSESAGIFRAVRRGVTDHAIGSPRQIFTAPYRIRVFEIGGDAGRVGGGVNRKGKARSSREFQRAWAAYISAQKSPNAPHNNNDNHY